MTLRDLPIGAEFFATAPLRIDFVGMADFFLARGINVNAALYGLSANLYATVRADDLVQVRAGRYGESSLHIREIYEKDSSKHMFFKALKMYPEHRITNGFDIYIDCQYGAGGLSTSSSVAAAIHAFLEAIFDLPKNPLATVWRVIRTEPHFYGRQDQLAAVYGGINMWEMEPDEFNISAMTPVSFHPDRIKRREIVMAPESLRHLKETIMIYESGIAESAGVILHDIAQEYRKDPISLQQRFDLLNRQAIFVREVLLEPHDNAGNLAEQLGPVLNDVKEAHANLHTDVMNQRMHDLFEAATNAGATGGRINGAGRRGTIQLCVPPHLHAEVQHALDTVDTPGPERRRKLKGELVRHEGFGAPGARCYRQQ